MTIATPTAPTATPKVKTTADVLRHAALIIEEYGWNQKEYRSQRGSGYCIKGAVGVAVGGDVMCHIGHSADDFLTGFFIHTMTTTPISWNDTPGRTAAEVTAALRAAADASERVS